MITAEELYEAYGKSTNYKNFLDQPMPQWEALPDRIQTAWDAAAKAANRKSDDNFLELQTLKQWKEGAVDGIEYLICRNEERHRELEERCQLRAGGAYEDGWNAIIAIAKAALEATSC